MTTRIIYLSAALDLINVMNVWNVAVFDSPSQGFESLTSTELNICTDVW